MADIFHQPSQNSPEPYSEGVESGVVERGELEGDKSVIPPQLSAFAAALLGDAVKTQEPDDIALVTKKLESPEHFPRYNIHL